jgi:aminomuconate-semialdehyde/2-hydroxymuconate-6-semialdehyde dehydrogenase
MDRIENCIGGEIAAPLGGAYLDNVDPATGAVYSQVADSDARDVERAVDAAAAAFPGWSRTPARERSAVLLRIAGLIEARLEELALAECIDNGKPLHVARAVDIPRAAANFRFFATAILHTQSESHATDTLALNYTLRAPRGVAGLISPWNLPLYLFTWKVAPALATGNTAVAKPSEVTPVTAARLGEICREAGLPPGVLNIVHGAGPKAGAAIAAHPRIPTISFTGGTVTGAAIAQAAAPLFKKVSLELGGKNPTLVFADADFEAALEGSLRAAFSNQGQICLCGSRIFVERSRHDEFVERFTERARALRVGDPLEPTSNQGALVSRVQLEKVASYVELARREGGTVRCGGRPPEDVGERCRNGFFFEPTVITGLDARCRVNREEIFGPVVTVLPFDGEAEAVDGANGTDYGLAASIWTQNLSRAHRVAAALHAGTVWINCWMLRDLRVPFGGMKQSGVGREGGEEALRFFTEPKNVCVKIPEGGK